MTLAPGDYMNLAFSTITKGNKSYFLKGCLPHCYTLSQNILGYPWYIISVSFPNQELHIYLETVLHNPEIHQVLNSFKVETLFFSSFHREIRGIECPSWNAQSNKFSVSLAIQRI